MPREPSASSLPPGLLEGGGPAPRIRGIKIGPRGSAVSGNPAPRRILLVLRILLAPRDSVSTPLEHRAHAAACHV